MEQSSVTKRTDLFEAVASSRNIHDAALVRRGGSDSGMDVLYTAARTANREVHTAWVTDGAADQVRVGISCLPRDIEGRPNTERLSHIPIITDEVIEKAETVLREVCGPEATVAAARRRIRHERPWIYLPDIQGRAAAEQIAESESTLDRSRLAGTADTLPRGIAHASGGPLTIPDDAPSTMTEAFLATSRAYANKGIVHAGNDREFLQTYAQLEHAARRVAGGLQAVIGGRRVPVVLQVTQLDQYFSVFWGCILAGMIPVTVAVPPTYTEDNATVRKLRNVWKLLGEPFVVASSTLLPNLGRLDTEGSLSSMRLQAVEDLLEARPTEDVYMPTPDEIAFYQLTAGSTGVPKCIQERHGSLVSHIHHSIQVNAYTNDDVTLNWLPMDHVVPLLTFHLKDTYLGCTQVQLPTDVVLARPLSWLDAIERHQVTHTWSPNFGYNLVAKALQNDRNKSWDLRCVRRFMNAGEQVTMPVVRSFLKELAPYGVAEQTMQPAFGMAEVCTCMTYANEFTTRTGAISVKKDSLTTDLRFEEGPDTVSFIDNGSPAPGVEIRIADERQNTLREGVIGRFQIRGNVVTPGYLNNPSANEASFVGNGWFDTGDLGFIWKGHLFLTGRQKEIIIVNGANFYCYEIEDVVNEIPGVDPTFVGSCAVEDTLSGTEGLAIFFVPESGTTSSLRDLGPLVTAIREHVQTALGIYPYFVVPISKTDFPKTTSGKIQRSQLRDRLRKGEFNATIRTLDLIGHNPRTTLPQWFFEPVWRPHKGNNRKINGTSIVITDKPSSLSQAIARAAGADLVLFHDGDVTTLVNDIKRVAGPIGNILYVPPRGNVTESVIAWHFVSLVQSFEKCQNLLATNACMLVCTTALYRITDNDRNWPSGACLAGLVGSADRELGWLQCRLVDLQGEDEERDAVAVCAEMGLLSSMQPIAYRDGDRFQQGLKPGVLRTTLTVPPPLKQGDLCLVTGGLGGVGLIVVQELVSKYGAQVLITGRRSEREVEGLLRQIRAAGSVMYVSADVACAKDMARAVGEAESRWGKKLTGVFHLAGVFDERFLLDEDQVHVTEMLRAKAEGASTLGQLLRRRGGGLFVSFSSVNGTVGAGGAALYAGASSYLDAHASWLRNCGIDARSLGFSGWSGIGMNAGRSVNAALSSEGLDLMMPEQALTSFRLALEASAAERLLIGLNPVVPAIASLLDSPCNPVDELVAVCRKQFPQVKRTTLPSVSDACGTPINWSWQEVDDIPIGRNGNVDRERLSGLLDVPIAQHGRPPETAVERTIVEVVEHVIGIRPRGMGDRLFDLGADSLGIAVLLEHLRRRFATVITRADLFSNPVLEDIAALCNEGVNNEDAVDSNVESSSVTIREPNLKDYGPYSLTPSQENIWQHWKSNPESWTYTMPMSLLISGGLQVDALRQALNDVVKHQDSLRTVFADTNTGPVQYLDDTIRADFIVEKDGQHLDPADVEILVAAEEHRVFDLRTGPLIRIKLLMLDEHKCVMVLTTHHIIFDGSSYGPFFSNLSRAYNARAAGLQPQFKSLLMRYFDYVQRQHSAIVLEPARHELEYWKEQLHDLASRDIMPDRACLPSEPRTAGYIPLVLAEGTGDHIRDVCGELQVTPFTLLVAATGVVLGVTTNNDDVALGTIVAGRSDPALTDVVGFFTNAVVLRLDVDFRSSFRELVTQAQGVVLEALDHQNVPFGEVIDAISLPELVGRDNPFYQVALVLQKDPLKQFHLNGLSVRRFREGYDIARGDFVIEFEERRGDYVGGIYYDADRFSESRAEGIASGLARVVEIAVRNSGVALGKLANVVGYMAGS